MSEAQAITPNNLEAEQAVLGAMLIDRAAVPLAARDLKPDSFYRTFDRIIFEALLAVYETDDSNDLTWAVMEELRRTRRLDEIGGHSYLLACVAQCDSSLNVEKYAKAVADTATERDLLKAADEIKYNVHHSGLTTEEKVIRAGSLITGLSERRATSKVHHLGDLIAAQREQIERCMLDPGAQTGLPTGFTDLDSFTGGLQPTDLVILAARPSMGKTASAIQVAVQAARYSGLVSLIYTLEMSKEQLTQRILSCESGVSSQDMRTGRLGDAELEALAVAADRLRQLPVWIEETPAQTIFQMHAHARSVAAHEGQIGLIVVDYLQLAHGDGRYGSRVDEVGAVTRGLKTLARQQNCPVLALASLSRAVEQREDKRPMLQDLRESGSIESDADVVMFLYREAYYKPREAKQEQEEAEVIIAKQRNGPTGTITLGWKPRVTRFVNLDHHYRSDR